MVENCPSCGTHRGHKVGCPLENPVLTSPLGGVHSAIDPEQYSIDRYREFLRAKCNLPQELGVPVEPGQVFETAVPGFEAKPHQIAAILWAVRGGRRALYKLSG